MVSLNFFFIISVFSISLFPVLISIVFFLLLVLDLICCPPFPTVCKVGAGIVDFGLSINNNT